MPEDDPRDPSTAPSPATTPARREFTIDVSKLLDAYRDAEDSLDAAPPPLIQRWMVAPLLAVPLLGVLLLWGFRVATSSGDQLRVQIAGDSRRLAERVNGYLEETQSTPGPALWEEWAKKAGGAGFIDPWGRPYLLIPTTRSFVIGTYGKDGAVGGDGENADLLFGFPLTPPK